MTEQSKTAILEVAKDLQSDGANTAIIKHDSSSDCSFHIYTSQGSWHEERKSTGKL
jgi:hypothetical protein